MTITGLGIVFAGGAGVPALREALVSGTPPEATTLEKEGVQVMAVPPAALTGNPVLAPARRADRFCKMTLLAAMEAWQGCGADPLRTGIILATAFGPHATVFRFVNEMLDFGDAKVSPTVFSQSVHAAAASMIATAAGLHGPALSLADLAAPFEEALALAGCWLDSGRCDAVLVGAADELSDVLAHVVRRKWPHAFVPGEGAVFFRLERTGGVRVSVGPKETEDAACHLIDSQALGAGKAAPEAQASTAVPVRSYSPLWGSTRLGSALHLAAAALMRREELPVADAALMRGNVQIVSACGTRRRVITLHA